MTVDISSSHQHRIKFSAPESAHNTVGACSTSNDSLTFCNICATNGFPHEAIRFIKVGEIEEIVPFDGIIYKVVRRPYEIFDYCEPNSKDFAAETSQLVKSIRRANAHSSHIAEFEFDDMLRNDVYCNGEDDV